MSVDIALNIYKEAVKKLNLIINRHHPHLNKKELLKRLEEDLEE